MTKVSQSAMINTAEAPAPVGPYSQAVRHNGLVFVSGQMGIAPDTGKIVHPTDVRAQSEQALRNLGMVLHAAGISTVSVLKTTIFLVRMADFAEVNAVYATVFESFLPARSCVAVSALPNPQALVEVEAIASV